MGQPTVRFASIDAYIATFSPATQQRLEELRAAIRQAAPGVEEKIAYHMPAFALHGTLVLFAAWAKHIGFYGTSEAIQATLRAELLPYANAKGSLLFPYSKPLPLPLIRTIVELRVAENRSAAGLA